MQERMEILTSTEIARIARAAARRAAPHLEVVGVTINAGGSDYVEILLEIRGCRTDSCQIVLGVFRNVSEGTLESDIAAQLARHVTEHARDDGPRE